MAEDGRDEKGRFKRSNLFSLGLKNNPNGRPPEYDNPDVMAQMISQYLDWEDEAKSIDAKGNTKGVYTLSGCALFLGFASVQSLYDYEKRSPQFSYVINRFRLFMTHWNEQKLYWGGTFAGSQFWLKNWGGYKDETDQNINQTITEVKPTILDTGIPLANDEKDIK